MHLVAEALREVEATVRQAALQADQAGVKHVVGATGLFLVLGVRVVLRLCDSGQPSGTV